MEQKSTVTPSFHGLCAYVRILSFITLLASVSLSAALARERLLIDSGWRFRLGDPGDVTTNVTVYPELNDLTKLQLSETNKEIQLIAGRSDQLQGQRVVLALLAARLGRGTAFHFQWQSKSSLQGK